MATGADWFTWIPNHAFTAIHAVTAVVALVFLVKAAKAGRAALAWAFGLYAVGSGVLSMLVHFGLFDLYALHVVESVLVFVAFILVSAGMRQ
jgi:hypothetical protein